MSQPNQEPGPRSRSVRDVRSHRFRRFLSLVIIGSLAAAALVYAISVLMLGMSPEDIGRLETPFALSVAMHLEEVSG